MIVASRLCRPDHSAFDGTGGLLRAGRWHERGSRVVYAADSEALAALEVLVRLTSVGQFPSYVCIKASIPESLVADIRDFAALPIDWSRRDPSETQAIGTRWPRDGSSAVLRCRRRLYCGNRTTCSIRTTTVSAKWTWALRLRLSSTFVCLGNSDKCSQQLPKVTHEGGDHAAEFRTIPRRYGVSAPPGSPPCIALRYSSSVASSRLYSST